MKEGVVKKCSRCCIIKPLSEFDNASQRKKSFKPYKVCRDCRQGKEPPYAGRVCSCCRIYKRNECFEKDKKGKYKKRCKICTGFYKNNIKQCCRCGRNFFSEKLTVKYCSNACESHSKLKKFLKNVDTNSHFILKNTNEKYYLKGYSKNKNKNDKDNIWFIFENKNKIQIATKVNNILEENIIVADIGKKMKKISSKGVKESKYFIGQLIGTQLVQKIYAPSRGFEYACRCIRCGFDYKKSYYNQEKMINGRLTPEREMNGKCKFCETGYAIIPDKNSAYAIYDNYLFEVIDNSELERLKTVGIYSSVKVKVICPKCGEKKINSIKDIVKNQSIGCSCGKGTSYPEKIFIEMLKQLRVKFIKEYNSNNFLEGTNRRYDFYIPSKNLIIEAHGEQHYTEVEKWGSLEHTQKNDVYKKEMALDYGIENYIVIDCRKSEVDYIKQNIMISKLSKIFDLTNIDWQLCHEYATGIYKGTREE